MLTRIDGIEKISIRKLEIYGCPLPIDSRDPYYPNRPHLTRSFLVNRCREYRKMAHAAFVEWVLAMLELELPIYLLLEIYKHLGLPGFGCSSVKPNINGITEREFFLLKRSPLRVLTPPPEAEDHQSYFNICVEDRSEVENITLINGIYLSWRRVLEERESRVK